MRLLDSRCHAAQQRIRALRTDAVNREVKVVPRLHTVIVEIDGVALNHPNARKPNEITVEPAIENLDIGRTVDTCQNARDLCPVYCEYGGKRQFLTAGQFDFTGPGAGEVGGQCGCTIQSGCSKD